MARAARVAAEVLDDVLRGLRVAGRGGGLEPRSPADFFACCMLAQALASRPTLATTTVRLIHGRFMLPPCPRVLRSLADPVAHGGNRLQILRDGGPVRQREVLVSGGGALDDL